MTIKVFYGKISTTIIRGNYDKKRTCKTAPFEVGRDFGNYAICSGVLLLILGMLPAVTVIFFLAALIVYAIVLLFWLLTLGRLFSMPSDDFLKAGGPVFEWFSKAAHACAPYLFAIAAVGAVVSIIIAIVDKRPHVGRIVCSSIALAFAVIGIILVYTAGGAL